MNVDSIQEERKKRKKETQGNIFEVRIYPGACFKIKLKRFYWSEFEVKHADVSVLCGLKRPPAKVLVKENKNIV